jgi:hypothetical protein
MKCDAAPGAQPNNGRTPLRRDYFAQGSLRDDNVIIAVIGRRSICYATVTNKWVESSSRDAEHSPHRPDEPLT